MEGMKPARGPFLAPLLYARLSPISVKQGMKNRTEKMFLFSVGFLCID